MNMKKLVSLLLALLMVMSMATAWAEDAEIPVVSFIEPRALGSITVTNPVEEITYTAYKIFDLKLDSVNQSHAYTIATDSYWLTPVQDSGYFTTELVKDSEGNEMYVVLPNATYNEAAATLFAAQLKDYLAANTPAPNGTSFKTTTDDANQQIAAQLELGYYFVTSSLGALCSLDTTNTDAKIEEKNEVPTVTKEVEEDSTNAWGATNDADLKQTVNFKATITVQTGAENYILHDEMSAGLSFNGTVEVKIGNTVVPATTTKDDVTKTNYTLITTPDDGCTFEVKFDNEYIAGIGDDTVIEIYYSAKLNENAVVGRPGNPNSVQLEYGDDNKTEITPEQTTVTYTWDMDVLKYANGDETKVLSGAQFVLLNSTRDMVAKIENGKFVEWVALADEMDLTNYKLTTDENGKIEIDGLDADTYYLRETDAPEGFNLLDEDIQVVIAATSSEDENGNTTLTYTTVVAKVNNQSGAELPSTGGMGTTLLYAVGGVLVLLAFVLIVSKRRAEEN